jgi:hypothetical protein
VSIAEATVRLKRSHVVQAAILFRITRSQLEVAWLGITSRGTSCSGHLTSAIRVRASGHGPFIGLKPAQSV